MRVASLTIAALLLIPVIAAAQTDEIALYTDPGFTNCELMDKGSGTVAVYVVHRVTGGAMSSQFMIKESSGSGLTYLGFSSDFGLSLGDPQSGITFAYQECMYGDVLVMTLNYFKSGFSDNCAFLQVVADPAAPNQSVTSITCTDDRLSATGTRLVINPDGTCGCGPTTEITNWGKIKDRFRD
jgi:hypothetical protein